MPFSLTLFFKQLFNFLAAKSKNEIQNSPFVTKDMNEFL